MNKLRRRSQKGFTILEIIIVVIIIGVLASLALPKYFKTVEYARGFEALITLGNLRNCMYRYYAPRRSYDGATLDRLDIENPNDDPKTSFRYELTPSGGPPTNRFLIKAIRKTDETSWISIDQDGVKVGNGVYSGI